MSTAYARYTTHLQAPAAHASRSRRQSLALNSRKCRTASWKSWPRLTSLAWKVVLLLLNLSLKGYLPVRSAYDPRLREKQCTLPRIAVTNGPFILKCRHRGNLYLGWQFCTGTARSLALEKKHVHVIIRSILINSDGVRLVVFE